MAKARLHILDQSRSNRQESIDALKEALDHAARNDIDGAIIILNHRNRDTPTILRAGKSRRSDSALLQVARMKLRLIVGND